MSKAIDYGTPDDEPRPTQAKSEALEPVVLPTQPLVPGQFGPGSIKGTKLKRMSLKKERALLEACSVSANLSQAVRRSGLKYDTVRRVLDSNPDLRLRVQEHLEYAIDRLEQASLGRAMRGTKLSDGRVVAPSDKLAVKILESRRSDVYGKKVEPGSSHVTNIAIMSREQLQIEANKPAPQQVESKTPKKLGDSGSQ